VTVDKRLVTIIEWALIAFLSIGLVVLLIDLPGAWNAKPCWQDPGQGCYPWGGEGPVAGLWNYASKQNYLASSIFEAALSGVALIGAFVISRRYRIFVLLAGIALLYASDFVLSRVM
jgi:hypothetical protein